MKTSQRAWMRAAGLGAISGLRSVASLALLSRYAARDDAWPNGLDLKQTPFAPLASRLAPPIMGILAAGEMSGDKMPGAPNRTSPVALIARIGSGAVAGAAIFTAEEKPAWQGALIGGAAAFAATFISFHLRQLAAQRSGISDKILGFTEDALVATGGAKLLMPPS